MGSIKRDKPDSNELRESALLIAVNRKDSVPPANNVLTVATAARLDSIYALYSAAMSASGDAKSKSATATANGKAAFIESAMLAGHFIQVFNLGVARRKFAKSERAFFGLEVNSNRVPKLISTADLLQWGSKLQNGDAERIARGGAPMSNPTIAECNTAYADFVLKNSESNNLKEALDMAQEAVVALNKEADSVIKKIWDEAETFYNEEAAPSRRANCRLWGVVYRTWHDPAIINLTVTDAASGLPIELTALQIEKVNNKTAADAAGKVQLKTLVKGARIIVAEAAGYISQQLPLTIEHGKTYNLAVALVKE